MQRRENKQHGTLAFPVELYHVDEKHIRYHMNCHWHPEHEMIRVLKGSLQVTLNETVYTVKKGEHIFAPGGTLLRAEPNQCVYECLVFNPTRLCRDHEACQIYMQEMFSGRVIPYHYTHDDSLYLSYANALFDAMAEQKEGYMLTVKGLIFLLMGSIAEHDLVIKSTSHAQEKTPPYTNLKNSLELIKTSYAHPITLSQLAQAASMSPPYFCRLFKKITGQSPMEYVSRYRVECAAFQLLRTEQSVTEVAFSCGFNDLSYFTKTFKKYKNHSPRSFRKQSHTT